MICIRPTVTGRGRPKKGGTAALHGDFAPAASTPAIVRRASDQRSHSRDRAGHTSTVAAAATERQPIPAASVPLRQHRDLQDRAGQLGARSHRSNAAGSLLSLFRVCELHKVGDRGRPGARRLPKSRDRADALLTAGSKGLHRCASCVNGSKLQTFTRYNSTRRPCYPPRPRRRRARSTTRAQARGEHPLAVPIRTPC